MIEIDGLKYGSPVSSYKPELYLLLLDPEMPDNISGYIEWRRENEEEKKMEFEEYARAMKNSDDFLREGEESYEKLSFNGTELIVAEVPVIIDGKKYYIERTERLVLAD